MLAGSALISGFVEQESPEWCYLQIVLIVAAFSKKCDYLGVESQFLSVKTLLCPFIREGSNIRVNVIQFVVFTYAEVCLDG